MRTNVVPAGLAAVSCSSEAVLKAFVFDYNLYGRDFPTSMGTMKVSECKMRVWLQSFVVSMSGGGF